MTGQGIAQIVFYSMALVVLGYPLGVFMSRVYAGLPGGGVLGRVEHGFYRLVGTDVRREQDWRGYAKTVLVFSFVATLLLYAIQRLQHHLFLNPDHLPAVAPHIA